MAVAERRLAEIRAVQLAIVHLTRRADVQVIQEPTHSDGPDLTVSLLEEGRNVGRLLAVEVKAVTSGKRIHTLRLGEGQEKAHHSYRFPLCLFAFSMDDDQGYWRWLRRPISGPSENRRLITEQSPTLHPLTTDAISQMLEDVRRWYGA